jgi:hypothetical protein
MFPLQTQKFRVNQFVRLKGDERTFRIGAIHQVALEYWYQLVEKPRFLVHQSRLIHGKKK